MICGIKRVQPSVPGQHDLKKGHRGKVLAAASVAIVVTVVAGCAPITETFYGKVRYTTPKLSDGNLWNVQQGQLSNGAYFTSKCMIPWIQNGPPVPKDKGCFQTLRIRGKVYNFAGKNRYLSDGTFNSTTGKETLTVRESSIWPHPSIGDEGDYNVIVDFKH